MRHQQEGWKLVYCGSSYHISQFRLPINLRVDGFTLLHNDELMYLLIMMFFLRSEVCSSLFDLEILELVLILIQKGGNLLMRVVDQD